MPFKCHSRKRKKRFRHRKTTQAVGMDYCCIRTRTRNHANMIINSRKNICCLPQRRSSTRASTQGQKEHERNIASEPANREVVETKNGGYRPRGRRQKGEGPDSRHSASVDVSL